MYKKLLVILVALPQAGAAGPAAESVGAAELGHGQALRDNAEPGPTESK